MGYIAVEPDVRLFVEDINPAGKETIVFVHGWPLTHETFEYQYDVLPTDGYRCVGVDLRGFGEFDRPWSGVLVDRFAEDLHVVVDKLNLKRFALVGHSMGGASRRGT